jgi:hypothetical protein
MNQTIALMTGWNDGWLNGTKVSCGIRNTLRKKISESASAEMITFICAQKYPKMD